MRRLCSVLAWVRVRSVRCKRHEQRFSMTPPGPDAKRLGELPPPATPASERSPVAQSLKDGVLRHLLYTLGELPPHADSIRPPYVAPPPGARPRITARRIRPADP